MNFKDQLKKDLNVFINEDEFAEQVNINGTIITVVIDSDLLQEHNLRNGGEGLAQGKLLFHAKKSDFSEELFIEKSIRFNNEPYRISDLQDNAEMYTITLEGYRS